MSTNPKLRRLILTASVAAITVMGTLYGAGLKTRRDVQQAHRQKTEVPDEEKLEALLGMRRKLVERRDGILKRVEEVRGRTEGGR